MSLLESFLGNAAGAGASILGEQAKNDFLSQEREKEARLQDELLTRRQKVIEAMREESDIRKEQRTQERAEAPLKRMGGIMDTYRGKEIAAESPGSEAYQNMQLTGEGTGSGDGGFKGGIENALLSAQDIKDPSERKAALDQIQSQINYQSDGIRAAAPKTRKMTTDEAEQAALSEALAKDPVAYAAYQKEIGAPRRAERREDTREDRAASQDATTNRRLDIQEQFNAERAKHQEAMEKLQMDRLDKQDGRQSDQMDKAELQSKRLAITSVLKDIGTQEDKLQVRLADPTLDVNQKAILVNQMKTLDADRNAAKNFLYEMSGVDTKPVDKAYPPAPPAAVQRLRDNPDKKAEYETLFGPGSADAVLKKTTPIVAQARTQNQPTAAATVEPEKPKAAEPAKPLSNLEQIQANNIEAVKPLAAQVKQAEAALAAVARSGDATAASRYAKELLDLRAKLEAEVNSRFGNGAKAILASLQ